MTSVGRKDFGLPLDPYDSIHLGPVLETTAGTAEWGYATLEKSPIHVNGQMIHFNAIQVVVRKDVMSAANPIHDRDFDALQTLYGGHYQVTEQDGRLWVIFGVPAE